MNSIPALKYCHSSQLLEYSPAVLRWHLCLAADSGSVSGTVADPSGAVIPGAAVVLRNPASGSRTVRGRERRRIAYSFAGVAAGHYEMQVDVPGLQALWRGRHRASKPARCSVPM